MNAAGKLSQIDEAVHPGPGLPRAITPHEKHLVAAASGAVMAALPEIAAAIAQMYREHAGHPELMAREPEKHLTCAGCDALAALETRLGL